MVWRDNRETPPPSSTTSRYDSWGAVFNAQGTYELVDDFEVLASFNDHHNDYPSAHHIVFSPTINKLVVQSVIDAPTTAPGYPINDGRSRYRTYSLTP